MGRPRLFAVAGNPILHSKSPAMFQAAFSACSMDALYLRFAPSRTEEIVQTALSMNIAGFNITSPYKEEVLPFLDDVETAARKSGAVNTVIRSKGKFKGFNTDIEGVRKALLTNGVSIAGKKAIILGAGGAARAAVFALVDEGARVTLMNRTIEKAQEIARTLSCRVVPMETITEEMKDTDILISCLSGDSHIIPSHSLTKGLTILDAHYRGETPLVREAKIKGCTIIDGREWLLFQGAYAFGHYTGEEPPVAAMRKALYDDQTSPKRNIALIGFMGTGKSIVGTYLAERFKMSLIDIDSEIVQRNGSSIENIFQRQGEEVFRRMEEEEIKRSADMSGRIISCGGGAILNKVSMDHLKEHALVIWLCARAETIMQRISNDRSRPLLNVKDRLSEVEQMFRSREGAYAYASDLFINTDEKGPEEIAERIYNESNTSLRS